MTTYYAYDNGLPCRNPACKSHGQPHPNCKCYAFKAEGGEAKSICEAMQPHEKGCEYYADGGDTIDPSQVTVDSPDTSASNQPIDPDQVKIDQPSSDIDPSQVVLDSDQYGTGVQQAIAGVEGLAQGYLSKPIATAIETHLLGVSPEGIVGREQANPITHTTAEAAGLGAGFLTGTGEAGIVAKGVGKLIPEAAALGKIGSTAIKGFIENSIFQGTDEIGNAMLGKGDPEAPWSSALAHMGIAGVLGGIGGAAFGSAKAGLRAIGESQFGTRMTDFLSGIGAASRGEEIPGGPMFNAGMKFYNKGIGQIIGGATRAITDVMGGILGAKSDVPGGGPLGLLLADKISPYIEKLVGRPITGAAQKYVPEAVMKILSSGESVGAWDALNYANQVGSGAQKIANGINGIFMSGSQPAVDSYYSSKERDRKTLKKFIEEGGLNDQIESQLQGSQPHAFASGGEVKPLAPQPGVLNNTDPLSRHWPDQGLLMGATKGRVVNYLNSLRPIPPAGKLPYDVHHEDPQQERVYDRAIDMALQPLSILNHIKSGSLDPEILQHFKSMYPELHNHLSKKLTERITKTQIDEEKPNYSVRQSMSYFLGAPLDSTFMPMSIQAAQSVFMKKQQQQSQPQTPNKLKRGTAPLSKASSQYETGSQASIARQRNS